MKDVTLKQFMALPKEKQIQLLSLLNISLMRIGANGIIGRKGAQVL